MISPTQQLLELSHWLGDPARELVLLGEGNASMAAGDGRFLVTASGAAMGSLTANQLVRMDLAKTLAVINNPTASDPVPSDPVPSERDMPSGMLTAQIDATPDRRPSVEAPLHAVCLALPGVQCVAHTHPTAINAITCSVAFEQTLQGRIFHDEILLCGVQPLLLPFVPSGLPLATALHKAMTDYAQQQGQPPKTIYLQNHGFVALGHSPQEVMAITAMAVKSATIRLGASALGGVHPLADQDVAHIANSPDERYRQLRLRGGENSQ